MLTTGSNSFSPGTSIHVISSALGSPGEQGVKRSHAIMLGSVLDGPRTFFKSKDKKGNKLDNNKTILDCNKKSRLIFYPFEVGCWLDLSYRLHESISDNYTDICTGVSSRFLAKIYKIRIGETVRGRAQMQLEHERTGMLLRQGYIDPLLKSDSDSTVSITNST